MVLKITIKRQLAIGELDAPSSENTFEAFLLGHHP